MTRTRFVQFTNLDWRQRLGIGVIAILGIAAALAFVLLSVGLAIFLVPVIAVAWLVARWRLNRLADTLRKAAGPRQQQGSPRTIEVEYHVLGRDGDEPK
jgi:hypothetical protein